MACVDFYLNTVMIDENIENISPGNQNMIQLR